MSKSNQTLGLIFILLGIVGILGYFFDFHLFSMAKLWPLFLLIPGLAFEVAYFSTKSNAGLLVPGGILITLGSVFLFNTYTNWHFAGCTWPFYVLAPAVGLFQLYLFGGRNSGLLIPVLILTLVAGFGFLNSIGFWISSSLIWPIILIGLGLVLLFGKNNVNAK